MATPAGCVPAGSDATSVAAAATFSQREATLAGLLAHAGALRAQGGQAITATAASLAATEAANEAAVSGILHGHTGAPGGAGVPTGAAAVPPPPPSGLPAIPVTGVPMPDEAWSAAIHGGPGAGPLREYAARMQNLSTSLASLSDDIASHGDGVDASWGGGRQQAGANTRQMGQWLASAARYAAQMASAASNHATHVETARQGTPPPQQFVALHQRVADGYRVFQSTGNPVQFHAATADLTAARQEASDHQAGYIAAAQGATQDLPTEPQRADGIADKVDPKANEGAEPKPGGSSDDDAAGAGKEADGTDDEVADADDKVSAAVRAAAAEAGEAERAAAREEPLAAAATAAAPPGGGMPGGGMPGGMPSGGMPSGGMPGGGMPMSALSQLAGLGQPKGDSGGDSGGNSGGDEPDEPGGTMPSSFGGDLGSGGGGGAPAMPVMSSPAAGMGLAGAGGPTPGLGGLSGGAGNSSGGGRMGGGMFPPMMGAPAGQQGEAERDKDLNPDKRVVHRGVSNTEPVFGELERTQRRRPKRPAQDQEVQS
ncbi:PPE domain-containing protein [Mycobacterium sp. M1]|uniref:PPE domain-containing protein n=1 Tax=Mycolicibacter acidiphilus TaxID=2835306 RepID=A0ABS5RPC2_9MYCO|nr:PPE domain-containing protein [Mycolicibacter acidiphilus]